MAVISASAVPKSNSGAGRGSDERKPGLLKTRWLGSGVELEVPVLKAYLRLKRASPVNRRDVIAALR